MWYLWMAILLKVFKVWSPKRAVISSCMNKRESWNSGEHHLAFAGNIKAFSPLHFDVCVGLQKKGSFGGISNSAFLPASFSTLMCLKQTNVLSIFSGSVDSILALSQQPKGARTTMAFVAKRQLRCSTYDRQPFSQSVSQTVNQFGKECQGPHV